MSELTSPAVDLQRDSSPSEPQLSLSLTPLLTSRGGISLAPFYDGPARDTSFQDVSSQECVAALTRSKTPPLSLRKWPSPFGVPQFTFFKILRLPAHP